MTYTTARRTTTHTSTNQIKKINTMGKTKELLEEELNFQNEYLDDEFRVREWQSRERENDNKIDATKILTDLFKSFGIEYK